MASDPKEQLQTDMDKILVCSSQSEDELQILEADEKVFISSITAIRQDIEKRRQEVQSTLDSNTKSLLNQVLDVEQKHLSALKARKESVKEQLVNIEALKKNYSKIENELIANKTPSYDDFLGKAAVAIKKQDEHNRNPLLSSELSFITAASTAGNAKNIIGEIDIKAISVSATAFLTEAIVQYVMPAKGGIGGIAVHDSELYVTRTNVSHIEVYDVHDFKVTRPIKIPDLQKPEDLVASDFNHCLYISEPSYRHVYRVSLREDKEPLMWTVTDPWSRLSEAPNNNVLLTQYHPEYPPRMHVYSTNGNLLRSLTLDITVERPIQSIQLSSGQYAVCHRGDKLHRVCLVDTAGKVAHCVGGRPSSRRERFNSPAGMAVDKYDHIFVVDCKNNRVRLLSPTLGVLGDVLVEGIELERPVTIHYDEANGKLYIGEDRGGRLIVVAVNRLTAR